MINVSVIIPTYNRAKVLGRAVESVLAQTYLHYELIIVDDGSTDETQALLESYSSYKNVKIVRTKNKGVSAARNLGIQLASGDWVAFLDSDDEWLPQKLELQMQYVSQNPNIQVVHGEEIWIRNGVRVNPMKKHQKSGGDIFNDATRFCCMSPSTILIATPLLIQRGCFDESFPVCEDYDLWLRLSYDQKVGFIQDFIINKYGGHEDQLSSKYHSMDYWRIRALKKVLSFPLSEEQKRQVEFEIAKKSKILLKGYRKHQNLENFDEVFFSQL